MLILILAWRNLLRHTKKTVLLVGLITLGIAVLFVANSIFEGTNSGLKRSLIGSLTGDAVLSAETSTSVSIFGSEIPIVSEYESIKPIPLHSELIDLLATVPHIEAQTSIVSAAARVEIGDFKRSVPLFGVDPGTYFDVCVDVSVDRGDINALAAGGVFLNSKLAEEAEISLGRPLSIGEPVMFSMYVGNSFRLRTAYFAGVHSYIGSSEILDRVVLADLSTVRSLANYTLGFEKNEESDNDDTIDGYEEIFDVDNLFNDNYDIVEDGEIEFDLTVIESELADTIERDSLVLTDNGAWSFVLLRAEEEKSDSMISELKDVLKKNNLGIQYISWRSAAGSTALSVLAVQSLFYFGLGFLAFGAVLIIMNALVISVLERSKEIGTMRSLGAPVGFIRKLFVAESMIITMGSAVLGIAIGAVISLLLVETRFELHNPIFISLFGGAFLKPQITLFNVLLHGGIASFVGVISWIYPVSLAMRVQPLMAINKV